MSSSSHSLSQLAHVQGQVTDKITGQPVSGARISAPGFGLAAVTDADGAFTWRDILLPGTVTPTTITITADGYGDWTIQDVRLLAGDTLILTAELSAAPTHILVPPPRAERPDWPEQENFLGLLPGQGGHTADQPLPASIRVRVTGYPHCDTSRPYTVEEVEFRDYAKHVLPNEWINTWPAESLRAGAVAVKMYAWYWVALGGKWSNADVYDSTCDQVYNPAVAYASTNDAVDYTWDWQLTRAGFLLHTSYRAFYSQCVAAGLEGSCMGQWESKYMADDGATWQEILAFFYLDTVLSQIVVPGMGYSVRFYGNGEDDIDRIKIQIDDPANNDPGPPADVGAQDFTIEWWMKALAEDNSAGPVSCGANINWIHGNIVLDRDRFSQDRKFGVSIAGGRPVFGVSGQGSGDRTICGTNSVADGQWHHVAVQRRRSDGRLWLYVDGQLEASNDGPDGDVSYPDDGIPGNYCGEDGQQPCTNSDPYLVLGAEKHDAPPPGLYPSYSGWVDDVRLSSILRYTSNFQPLPNPFAPDANTVGLYHFDVGGNVIHDDSGAAGGPSDGLRSYGGVPGGPVWAGDTPFYPCVIASAPCYRLFFPQIFED